MWPLTHRRSEPEAPTGVRFIRGDTGEATECMVVYVGDDNEGVHNFEIANPGVDFDVLRGDSIAVEVLPARTVVIFSFSF